MTGKLKSSWELALEKLHSKGEVIADDRLSATQKNRIDLIRKEYKAKLAEREIMFKNKIAGLVQKVKPEEFFSAREKLEKEYTEEVAKLKEELEIKIQSIRLEK